MSTEPVISGRDIIVVGQQPWDVEIGSNCKNIAEEFSKHNRVLYVNSALDRFNKIKNSHNARVKFRLDVIDHQQDGLVKLKDNLWTYYPDTLIESINWIHQRLVFNQLNKVNNKRFAASIQRAIAKLGFKDYILFNDSDIFKKLSLTGIA